MATHTAATKIQHNVRRHLAQNALLRARVDKDRPQGLSRTWLYWCPNTRRHRIVSTAHSQAVAEGYEGVCELGWVYTNPSEGRTPLHAEINGGPCVGYLRSQRTVGSVAVASYYSAVRSDHLPVCNKQTQWIRDTSSAYGAPYTEQCTLGWMLQYPGGSPHCGKGLVLVVTEDTSWLRVLVKSLPDVYTGGCRGAVAKPRQRPRPPQMSPTPDVVRAGKGVAPPRSSKLCKKLIVEKAKEALERMVRRRRVERLTKREEEVLAERLHGRHKMTVMKMSEKVDRVAREGVQHAPRLTSQEERDMVERMFYGGMRRASDTAHRLKKQYTAAATRHRLTREAQDAFAVRLKEDKEYRAVRKQQSLDALPPAGPPTGYKTRPKRFLELHAKELYENVPTDSRTTLQ